MENILKEHSVASESGNGTLEKIEKRDGYSETILKKLPCLSLPWFHSFTVEESEKQDFANWKNIQNQQLVAYQFAYCLCKSEATLDYLILGVEIYNAGTKMYFETDKGMAVALKVEKIIV